MARVPKFVNENTSVAQTHAEEIHNESVNLTKELVETQQSKFGLSDTDLSNYLEIDKMVLSRWKNGVRGLLKYYLISINFLFKYLEQRMKK